MPNAETRNNESTSRNKRMTRGTGLLEPFLARQRAIQANRLIPSELRSGRILDIGCGSYPYFLSHSAFKEKFAVEQQKPIEKVPNIHWFTLDFNSNVPLPFEENFFNVVTLLAVIEHLDPNILVFLFQEAYRVLNPSGYIIITTPAAWSDGLLRLMSRWNLVSKEEIDEHVFAYTLPLLGWYFGKAGFSMQKIRFGYFEFWLNLWAIAQK